MFPGMIYGPVAGAIMGLMVGAMFFPAFSVTLPWIGLFSATADLGMMIGPPIGAIIGFFTALWVSKRA